jgi:hypothetical protein
VWRSGQGRRLSLNQAVEPDGQRVSRNARAGQARFDKDSFVVQSERRMTVPMLLRKPSAIAPVVMSLAALVLVFTYIALHGTARQADEGAVAHLWQLLMAAQLPIIGFFVIKWLPQHPKYASAILALQCAAAVAALAPVYLLHW